MLPIRLKVYNFLPYRDPEALRFDGIHMACLTGQNGAGKSSLLDAITWALWGEARGRRISDSDFMHQGQTSMYVELDFSHEGSIYRVIRKREGRLKGKSTFDVYEMRDGTLHLRNSPGIRETQEELNKLLNLDYRTFVTSAYLQQGRADAFTTMAPAERKALLAEILGIEQWQTYEENTKKVLESLKMLLNQKDAQISTIVEELRREPQLKLQVMEAETREQAAKALLDKTQAEVTALKDAERDLSDARERLRAYERDLRTQEAELTDVQKRITEKQMILAELQGVIVQREAILAGHAQLTTARQQNNLLGERLRLHSDLEKQKNVLLRAIEKERSTLEKDFGIVQANIGRLQAVAMTDHSAEIATLQTEISDLQAADLSRLALIEQEKELRVAIAEAKGELASMTADGKKLNTRMDKLEALSEAICPTCGQPISAETKAQVLEEWRQERDAMRLLYAPLDIRYKEMQTEADACKQQIVTIGEPARMVTAKQRRLDLIHKEQSHADEAQVKLTAETADAQALSQRLTDGDYAHDDQNALAGIEQQLNETAYDASEHDDLRRIVTELSDYEAQFNTLRDAEKTLTLHQEALQGFELRQQNISGRITQLQADHLAQNERLPQMEQDFARYTQLNSQLKSENTAHTNAFSTLIAARQELNALESQRVRRKALETERDQALQQQSDYDSLRLAFGKKGVQAMIIESAIPQLETLANDLLTGMTEGRMHLRLTTQQANQDGTVRETLDIEVADELGTRPYELYSGGEAFRINFALRVALSQMLARRSGAHLQALFIDEGFGTQDEEGRVRLVEAIRTISNRFDMILVITHMEDLRDQFPVHIVVEKTSEGSRFSLR